MKTQCPRGKEQKFEVPRPGKHISELQAKGKRFQKKSGPGQQFGFASRADRPGKPQPESVETGVAPLACPANVRAHGLAALRHYGDCAAKGSSAGKARCPALALAQSAEQLRHDSLPKQTQAGRESGQLPTGALAAPEHRVPVRQAR